MSKRKAVVADECVEDAAERPADSVQSSAIRCPPGAACPGLPARRYSGMDSEREDYSEPDPYPRPTAALGDLVALTAALAFSGSLVFLWHLLLR